MVLDKKNCENNFYISAEDFADLRDGCCINPENYTVFWLYNPYIERFVSAVVVSNDDIWNDGNILCFCNLFSFIFY